MVLLPPADATVIDPARRIGDYRQALNLARLLGDRHIETDALIGLAGALHLLGHTQDALTIARRAGYRLLEGQALTTLAAIHLQYGQGEPTGARRLDMTHNLHADDE